MVGVFRSFLERNLKWRARSLAGMCRSGSLTVWLCSSSLQSKFHINPMHGVDLSADFIQVSRFDSLAEKGVAYHAFINAGCPQTQAAICDSLVKRADGPTSLYNSAGGSSGK